MRARKTAHPKGATGGVSIENLQKENMDRDHWIKNAISPGVTELDTKIFNGPSRQCLAYIGLDPANDLWNIKILGLLLEWVLENQILTGGQFHLKINS